MITLLALAAHAAPLAEVPRDPGELWITDVAVFDSEGEAVTGPHDVHLRDGRIAAVAPAGSAPADALTVDGAGDTLLPGLIDLHVHVGAAHAYPGRLPLPDPKDTLAAFAYAGVTTVLDLSHPTRALEPLRRRIERGRLAGPRIYGSGKPFGAPDGHPGTSVGAMYPSLLVKLVIPHLAWAVATPEQVDRALERESGRDVAKVMLDAIPLGVPTLGADALIRLRERTRQMGLRLLAHVGSPADLQRGIDVGVDAFAHLPYGGALSDAQIASVSASRTPVIATLAVWQSSEQVATGSPSLEPLEAEILPARGERDIERCRAGHTTVPEGMQGWAAHLVEHSADRAANAARLHAAGAPLLVGSDSPNLGLAAGWGTHVELDLLRSQAGLSAAEALSAATWHNSRFLDPDARFGAVREGWEADLLLVDGDPVADPAALQRIREVWVDGRRLTRHPR